MSDLSHLRDHFKNPPCSDRSVPLWSWNDKLMKEELVKQIEGMKEQGMGGFFIHSREGLEDLYMGTEWMKSVNVAVQTAKDNGLAAWIYDDDRWPSGAAGGLVAAQGKNRFSAKALTLQVISNPFNYEDPDVLAIFKATVDEDNIESCDMLEWIPGRCIYPEQGEVLLVFRMETSRPCEWYNHQAPPDNLNPETISTFINITHEVYKKELSHEFGKTIPGFFTDEPNVADFFSTFTSGRAWLPWTEGFQAYFTLKKGYELLPFVPYLFFKGKKSSETRHDYWHVISDRFCETYSKQLGEWCQSNDLLFTGHYLFENDFGYATRVNGSIMPHYRYMDVPGIDILGELTEEYITVKQCTSVANQYRRKWSISEMYGCTGWEFTFEGQKWLGDWQFVLGINLRCQHHALYSLKGCRKRDFPPAFNYNTSWWKYNHVVEDYFARISSVLSEGEAVRDVLVLHPASTIWTMVGSSPSEDLANVDWNMGWTDKHIVEVNEHGEQFNQFLKLILTSHYDLDLGDETIIQETGRVKDGKFYVNFAEYSVVVIPPVTTLFRSTILLLEQFMNEGGKVIVVKPFATMVEGRESNELEILFNHSNIVTVNDQSEFLSKLENTLPRRVSIRNKYIAEASQFLYMLREQADCYVLFVVNNDRTHAHDVLITVNIIGAVEEWNLLNGEFSEIGVKQENGEMGFTALFGPAGSKLFVIKKDKVPLLKNTDFVYTHPHMTKDVYSALGPVCKFTRTMPNALTLDKCSYRIGNGAWSEVKEVWESQRDAREYLGMRQIYHNGLAQRYKWAHDSHAMDGTRVDFKFSFDVLDIPETDTCLAVEDLEYFDIQLNGSKMDNKKTGWFLDKSLKTIQLENIKQGFNELILSCDYLNKMEVEDIYLLGDFGVNVNRFIVKEPTTLHFGDWCMQGYFHYSGSIIYHLEYHHQGIGDKRAYLNLGDYSAVTVDVVVNGNAAGHIPWRSENGVDITALLQEGSNRINIEVMGSPRNLFGPLHQSTPVSSRIEALAFRSTGSMYTSEYIVKAYGLLGQVVINKI